MMIFTVYSLSVRAHMPSLDHSTEQDGDQGRPKRDLQNSPSAPHRLKQKVEKMFCNNLVAWWTYPGPSSGIPTPGDVHLHLNYYVAIGASPSVPITARGGHWRFPAYAIRRPDWLHPHRRQHSISSTILFGSSQRHGGRLRPLQLNVQVPDDGTVGTVPIQITNSPLPHACESR